MQVKVVLIVGSGVFGASTAYHLVKTLRSCRVIMIEKSSWAKQCGASIGVNKIIRVEYEDPVYLRLALRAQKAWREELPWSEFFHPAEKLTVGELDSQKRILAQMHQLGFDTDASIISVDETKKRYPGIFEEMAFHDCQETYVNPGSGWAEASSALAKVIKEAVHLGVELVQATVSRILFNDSGDCIGVLTEDGVTYEASRTIIATGADTAKLLADSAPNSEAFRVENRLMGSGCVEAVVKLNPAQREEFTNLPITVHDVGDIYGEVLPPTRDGCLKFASETTFLNSVCHPESGQVISVPAPTDHIPTSMINESRRICNDIFGSRGKELEFDSYRICWDAFTRDGSWIISPHTTASGLYFATGGSFHAWKFFPILGPLVVDMLEGNLEPALAPKWAWGRRMDSSEGDGDKVDKAPQREWRDLVDHDFVVSGKESTTTSTKREKESITIRDTTGR